MEARQRQEETQAGVPLWMPLLGLLIALCFTVVVGVRLFPTLGAMLFPPAPPLPTSGEVRLMWTENKGLGKDEWLYATDLNACEVMRYYADVLGDCKYDPSVNCNVGTGVGVAVGRGVPIPVGLCMGKQVIGAYSVTWAVQVATNYATAGQTQFRVTREVSN
ncbi:MAG: hypothetical protein CUN49_08265 [Candidatus Thermofonsia Clade 1 bacterium]|jgi:hypothetical protein|uniref:Uncharacterized protein n=1 Tax=Candidatus Thermofonsia Clade 1 bacterium TaxID=2364210 RepID=A0A2M8PEA4_9CHLR|nr:MAG: hypothetical protein CUN49_08265 [Candidatus Thermofonsia Clade 1 bacterium]RMF54132.1 MAG: hypothetical protein D6749_00300 [Chloroflexota bacterium]